MVELKEISFKSRGEDLGGTLYGEFDRLVIMCPPHPLYGGNRSDVRLVRVAEELSLRGISSLCIDYGPYGEGIEEVNDVIAAISSYKRGFSVGLFGYSFGSVVASNAAARTSEIQGFVAMSILRRVGKIDATLDFDCPKLFIHGRRDESYSRFETLFTEVRERKDKFVLDTDHFYLDSYPKIIDRASDRIGQFFNKTLIPFA